MSLGLLVTAKLVPRTLNKAAINTNLILVELEDTWRQLKGVLIRGGNSFGFTQYAHSSYHKLQYQSQRTSCYELDFYLTDK